MNKKTSITEYFETNKKFGDVLIILRELLNNTILEETIKWNMPTYTLNGKNVISFGAFKNHCCLWFYNGAFLIDETERLIKAQDKTKGMRQMRFKNVLDIDKMLVKSYINEAIENQKMGREIKPVRAINKPIIIPNLLSKAFKEDAHFKASFNLLTPGKKHEYCEYIANAKQDKTKHARLVKIKPLILSGVGLNDKYKKS